MSLFDITVHFIESFISLLFIFFILDKEKRTFLFFFMTLIYSLNLIIFHYLLLPEIILTITSVLISLTYCSLLNKRKTLQNIFLSLVSKMFNDVACTFGILITSCFFTFPFNLGYGSLCMIVTSKLILLGIVLTTSYDIKKYRLLETKKLEYLLFSIFILELSYSSITDFIFYNGILDSYIKILLIFINLLSLCLYVIFIETQKEQQYLLSLQRDKLSLETQEKIQSLNNENINELNKWKHDMNHVLNAIQYKMNHQEYDEANQIINQMNNHLNQTQIIMKTNNDLLDHLLLQKYDLLKNHDITLLTSYNTCICPLEDTHFCIILGNLLNNAIENCKGEHKFIYLLIEQKARYYHIEMKNTIHESVLEKNPYLITQKQDKEKHGVGIKSVRLLVDRYHGKISFHEQSGYFIVNIIIPNS